MNQNAVFPEFCTILPGINLVDVQDGNVVSDRVNAVGCVSTSVVCIIEAAGAATSAEQVTLALNAYATNSGGTATVISFNDIYVLTGASTIAAGTGAPMVRENNATAVTSWTTALASGTKQLIVIIPIRSRQMPAGKPFLALTVSGPTNARLLAAYFIRTNEENGPYVNKVLL